VSTGFSLCRLHLNFRSAEPIFFGKAANMLRGALGYALLKPQIFEPKALASGPSGLLDQPRPFVFRTAHLDGSTTDNFEFHIHLFQKSDVPHFIQAFHQLSHDGLGPNRIPIFLTQTDQADLNLTLAPSSTPINRVRVRFLTPTELKSGSQLAARPEFGILLSRIRDRISNLSALYGTAPLDLDYVSFGQRAQQVRMTSCELQEVRTSRTSSRTGQTHSLGGFVGEAEYEGELAEFVPFLNAAQYTGVGRQTSWGKGEILLTL